MYLFINEIVNKKDFLELDHIDRNYLSKNSVNSKFIDVNKTRLINSLLSEFYNGDVTKVPKESILYETIILYELKNVPCEPELFDEYHYFPYKVDEVEFAKLYNFIKYNEPVNDKFFEVLEIFETKHIQNVLLFSKEEILFNNSEYFEKYLNLLFSYINETNFPIIFYKVNNLVQQNILNIDDDHYKNINDSLIRILEKHDLYTMINEFYKNVSNNPDHMLKVRLLSSIQRYLRFLNILKNTSNEDVKQRVTKIKKKLYLSNLEEKIKKLI